MRIKIYQIDSEKDAGRVKFQSLKFTQKNGGIDPSCYKTVFYGDVEADNLEDIYHIFNTNMPGTHQGHSLSVSDIVEVLDDVPELAGRIDFLGNNGSVGETIEYTDLAEYKREIAESNNCGRPIRATLLTDRHLPCAAHGCYFCDSSGFEKVEFDSSQCAEMAGIRVLFITPRHSPLEIRIGNDLKSMQRVVEGMIEFTYPFEDDAIICGNDEAKLTGMAGNRRLNGDVYAGPIFIIRDDGEDGTTDLTDEQVQKYSAQFAEPEDISPEEVEAHTGFTFYPL